MRPSFLSQIISGVLIFTAVILYVIALIKNSLTLNNNIQIIIFLAIALSLHGLQHHNEELYYDFNPFENKWIPKDKPVVNSVSV